MDVMRRRAVLGVLAAAAAAACRPAPHEAAAPPAAPRSGRAGGLSRATAFVTVEGRGRAVRLDVGRTDAALDAVWQVLGDVPAVAPVSAGPRLLAVLRLNEQVLDVAIWKPQTLVVAARRLPNVSAVVVPVTGIWRHRLLVVQTGRVLASPLLADSPALAALDEAVRAAVGPR
jgi:hypothetical protein